MRGPLCFAGEVIRMQDHTSKVGQQFGAVAEAYLSSHVHRQGADLEAVAEKLQQKPLGRVLDLGCGAGHLSFAAAPFAEAVVAYDLSPEMIGIVGREARQRGHNNLSTQTGQVEKLPFEDRSFDWVLTRYSAHHWNDVRRALHEARRVLRSDGGLIIIDVCAPEDPLLDTHLQTVELLRDGSHVRDYSLSNWSAMLAEAGFEIENHSMWKLPLDFKTWVDRMNTPALFVDAIQALTRNAPQEVRNHFRVAEDGSFAPDSVLIEAR
jgi:ubiquinone/menaquinone biosynthesis C-methylase UbiE